MLSGRNGNCSGHTVQAATCQQKKLEYNCCMAAKAIEIDGLTKDYSTGFWRKRPRRALDSLSFHVESGEVCGFLGPNGAGKTTTLKLLMGLIFPTAGTARILGRPIEDVEMHPADNT